MFVRGTFIQACVIFASKAGAYHNRAPDLFHLLGCLKNLPVTNSLAYCAPAVSDEENFFYNIDVQKTLRASSITFKSSEDKNRFSFQLKIKRSVFRVFLQCFYSQKRLTPRDIINRLFSSVQFSLGLVRFSKVRKG